MKQIWIYTCAISLMSLFACQQEELPSNNNIGYLSLENISIQSANVETITTRAVDTDLYVEISGNGSTTTYDPGKTPSKIELKADNYTLKAYNAAYKAKDTLSSAHKGEAIYYIDSQSFTIEEGKVNYLSVEVPMTNIGVRLALPEGFSNWFNTYSFNVSAGNRSVSITNGETVYFPAGEITYTLSATNNDEEEFQLEGSSSKWVNEENEQIIITPGTIYVITYNYATQSLQLLNTPT